MILSNRKKGRQKKEEEIKTIFMIHDALYVNYLIYAEVCRW